MIFQLRFITNNLELSYVRFWVDGINQAADFASIATSIPFSEFDTIDDLRQLISLALAAVRPTSHCLRSWLARR